MSSTSSQVQALHTLGLGPTDIAHRLGVAHATVSYHLHKLLTPDPEADQRPSAGGRRRVSEVPTRALVSHLLARGLTRAEIARRLGIAKSTVSYHARQLGEPIDARCAKRFNWAMVQTYYDEGHSVRDCVRAFGFSSWAWHAAVQRGDIVPRPGFRPLEEVFADGTRRGRGHLKQRLLRAGLKDGTCERCGISAWLDKPLALALHHINGDRYDNRLENLELLCPNCHSQTDTYAGRNGRRREGM